MRKETPVESAIGTKKEDSQQKVEVKDNPQKVKDNPQKVKDDHQKVKDKAKVGVSLLWNLCKNH